MVPGIQWCPPWGTVASDLFLSPMDRIIQGTIHRSMTVCVGSETFTDLDYADDAALLAQMLEVLVLALEIMHFSIEISWTKTKIQAVGVNDPPVYVHIVWNGVEVVAKFTYYLGVLVPNTGSSEHEISRRIAMTRDCVHALQRRTWQTTIGLDIKIKLSMEFVRQYSHLGHILSDDFDDASDINRGRVNFIIKIVHVVQNNEKNTRDNQK